MVVHDIYTVRKFRPYLLSMPFVFIIDSVIMAYLVKKPNPAGRFVKWLVELQEFEFSFLTEHSTRATIADLLTGKEISEERGRQTKDRMKVQIGRAHV